MITRVTTETVDITIIKKNCNNNNDNDNNTATVPNDATISRLISYNNF